MLNDPVAVKLAEDRWWISIADSDLLVVGQRDRQRLSFGRSGG